MPGHRRDHHMERVGRARAMGGGIGERADELELLDGRARPAVADDQRQRVLVLRTDMNEMDVQPIDLGHELREGVQPRLALAPVVLGRPVAGELLHELQAAPPGSHRRPSRGSGRLSSESIHRQQLGTRSSSGTSAPERPDGGVIGGPAPGDVGRGPAVVLSGIAISSHRCRGQPDGQPVDRPGPPSRLLCRHGACGPPSVVGAGPRSRPTTGQSEWTVRVDSRGPAVGRRAAASLTGRWSGRWVGPDAAGRGS